jgi:hypothetical protein
MFQKTGITGKYPTLPEAIDKSLASWVGILDTTGKISNVPFDDGKRTKAVEYCLGLSWAFRQTVPKAKE